MHADLKQGPGDGGFDFHRRLVRLHVEEDIAPFHGLPRLLQPARDSNDRTCRREVRHFHFMFHEWEGSSGLAAAAEKFDAFQHGVSDGLTAGDQQVVFAAEA